MDFFGWSIWTELLTGDTKWIKALDLQIQDEFEPISQNWTQIFSKLSYVLKENGLNGKIGACLHTSSNVPMILHNVGMIDEFLTAKKEFEKNIPFAYGMHSTFGHNDLVTRGNYSEILKKDILLCESMGGTCIVEHPPDDTEQSIIEKVVDELISPPIIDILKNTQIKLAWENMSSHKAVFSELKNLVIFRERLSDKLQEIGALGLIENHQFCLDTGHLLLWRNRNKKGKKYADRQIEEFLPQFAKNIKAFHIHANNGKNDNHIVPYSLEFFDDKSRQGIKPKTFQKNSEITSEWLKICHQNKKLDGIHWHIEALILPFSLNQFIEYGKHLGRLFKL